MKNYPVLYSVNYSKSGGVVSAFKSFGKGLALDVANRVSDLSVESGAKDKVRDARIKLAHLIIPKN